MSPEISREFEQKSVKVNAKIDESEQESNESRVNCNRTCLASEVTETDIDKLSSVLKEFVSKNQGKKPN